MSRFYKPFTLSITDSSVPEHTDENGTVYDVWDIEDSHTIGSVKSHEGYLYEALANIYPLATFSFNDISEGITSVTTKLSDKTTVTSTSVPCVQNATIIYIEDSWQYEAKVGKYFKYTGTTGNVDLTSVDWSSPTGFSETTNYRNEDFEPTFKETSQYWGYKGATNRFKPVDGSYTSQAEISSSTEEWWEFETRLIDKITLFNIQARSATLTVYTTDINTPIYENTISSLLNTSEIINWRTLSRFNPNNNYTKNADWTLPFLSGTVTFRITLTNPTLGVLKIGEILAGTIESYATTLDETPIQVKSAGQITEKSNGDIVFEDEGDITKVYTIFDFTMSYPSGELDAILDKCASLINSKIVLFAENADNSKNRSFVIYGFIRDASPTHESNFTHSKISLQIQRFRG